MPLKPFNVHVYRDETYADINVMAEDEAGAREAIDGDALNAADWQISDGNSVRFSDVTIDEVYAGHTTPQPKPVAVAALKAVEAALEQRLTFPTPGSDLISVRAVIDALYILADTGDAARAASVMSAQASAYRA